MNDVTKEKFRRLLNDTQTVINGMTSRRGTISKTKIARVKDHRLIFETMADKTAGALGLALIEAVETFAMAFNSHIDFTEVERMGAKITEIAAEIEGLSGNV